MSENRLYDVVIIGGGPAGLTAALYCNRAGLTVSLVEKDFAGGKLNKTLYIENYPGYTELNGPKLGEYMFSQIEKEEGVSYFEDEVVGIEKENKEWKVIGKANKYIGRTVLITSGMKERVLDIPNVEEYYGNGVSYCAICDGNLYKDKRVVVVGGGNSAVEESLYLSDVTGGVDLVHRRREYRADNVLVNRMRKNDRIRENIPYIPLGVEVKECKVIGLKIKEVESGEEKLVEGDCVFFYVGLIPENYFLGSLGLEMDEGGFIKVDGRMNTSVKGIFAAGDVIHKELRQVVTAVNDGAIAAISIKNYINNLEG